MNRSTIIALVLTILTFLCMEKANGQQSFDDRLNDIDQILTEMADSISPGLNQMADFSVVNTPLQELLRGVAETHNLNVSLSPDIKATITNNFTGVTVKNLILFICKEYALDIVFINNILSFKNFAEPVVKKVYEQKKPQIHYIPATDMLSVDLQRDSLSVFVKELTRVAGKNVIISPEIQDKVLSGYVSNVIFDQALTRIAFINNLDLQKGDDNFYVITKRASLELETDVKPTTGPLSSRRAKSMGAQQAGGESHLYIEMAEDSLLHVEAVNVPIVDVIKEACRVLSKDYIVFSPPPGITVSQLENIRFDDLLDFLLHGTTHTSVKQNAVYLIGNRTEEGFRSTRLIKFQFRTVTDIEKIIPPGIVQNVQIAPFPELNAIILSGSSKNIKEIEDFLKAIDQPVPNITIEVIVIDLRKRKKIETGISAFLSDSTVSTGGKVFPGLDMNVSAKSINNILNKLEAIGSVNLGRVKPNFYVSLKALEENNNIKIRSTPKLSTLNGHEAVLTIGESVYFLEQTQNVTGGVNPIITTTPRFRDVNANLTIKIKPIVSGDEHVTLDIDAEFSNFIPPTIPGAPPGNATRKFVSQIRVLNEEMIVLGGLEEASKEKSASGFPILSRIPILKWLFSAKSDSKRDDKLIIFIKPTVLY